MKLKRTIAVAINYGEGMKVPDGELWVGYIDANIVVDTKKVTKGSQYAYGNDLARGVNTSDRVDRGRIKKFYGTPGSIIYATGNNAGGGSAYAFTCLVFDISKEVNNV
jgi:hypothetical protein|nr:MAG TPA: hypothetical protein [Caudoviricetes sp.]